MGDVVLRNSVERVVKLKVQRLTPEAFAPYGTVLDMDEPIFPEMDGGAPVFVKARISRKDGPQTIEQIANHFSYNQQFVILKGVMVMVVAPPPANAEADASEWEIDYENAAAFILEPGDCIDVNRGVWHNGIALSGEVLQMTQTRADVDKAEFRPAKEVEGGKVPVALEPGRDRMQAHIDYIDLKKRDNCVIEVTL